MKATLKPPLKWAGGKRWLVPHLKPIWSRYSDRRYVEPFCGGLAVVLGLQPERALLNDINPHLINFYRHLQNGMRLRIEMRNDEQLFYRHRERFNQLIQNGGARSSEAAWLRSIKCKIERRANTGRLPIFPGLLPEAGCRWYSTGGCQGSWLMTPRQALPVTGAKSDIGKAVSKQ